jgi:hypothetical protein
MWRNLSFPTNNDLELGEDFYLGEPVSRQQRANPVRLSSPTAEIGRPGRIKLGPVIFLILIVCAACLAYLWFSSDVKGSVRAQVQPEAGISNITVSTGRFCLRISCWSGGELRRPA